MTTDPTLMDLGQCARSLHTLADYHSITSTKTLREVYLAALTLLCHLKQDQLRLQEIRERIADDTSNTDKDGNDSDDDEHDHAFPEPSEVPAISAVVHDQRLFQALISCLSTAQGASGESDTSADSQRHHHHLHNNHSHHHSHHHHNKHGHHPHHHASGQASSRKRAFSMSDPPDGVPSKAAKIGMSPMVGKRSSINAPISSASSSSSAADANKKDRETGFNARVLCATILYIAFEALDHWPASLVKVYAEDCFGARLWVDDPCCKPLVQNLALCHGPRAASDSTSSSQEDHENEQDDGGDDDDISQSVQDTANKVANFYRMELKKLEATMPTPSVSALELKSLVPPTAQHLHSNASNPNSNITMATKQDGNIPVRRGSGESSGKFGSVSKLPSPHQVGGHRMRRQLSDGSAKSNATTASLSESISRQRKGGAKPLGISPTLPQRVIQRASIQSKNTTHGNHNIKSKRVATAGNINNNNNNNSHNRSNRKHTKAHQAHGDSDSDSGDEVEQVEIKPNVSKSTAAAPPPPPAPGATATTISTVDSKSNTVVRRFQPPAKDGDSSSSGEEEDEAVAVMSTSKRSFEESMADREPPTKITKIAPADSPFQATYPAMPTNLKLAAVRCRYFANNLQDAHSAIAASLIQRLDAKTKQNSGLLQTLPSFTSVPAVRDLVTSHLQKWLQSPALSGLARSLFSQTVKQLRSTAKLHDADVATITNVLSMRLKANQLNAHIENIKTIADGNTNKQVSSQIYMHLLRDVLNNFESDPSAVQDRLRMLVAVYSAFPKQTSAEGIASTLLIMLTQPPEQLAITVPKNMISKRVRSLLLLIANKLGSAFDAFLLLRATRKFKFSNGAQTMATEEARARMMYQCCVLLVPASPAAPAKTDGSTSVEPNDDLRATFLSARKLVLGWSCMHYAPLYFANTDSQSGDKNGSNRKPGEEVGAGAPEYASILDGMEQKKVPPWLAFIRCMLFLENHGSERFDVFWKTTTSILTKTSTTTSTSQPGGNPSDEWAAQAQRINAFVEYGTDVDDEMIFMIIKSVKRRRMTSKPALQLLEHLFHGCRSTTKARLLLEDDSLIEELYTLVEYKPPKEVLACLSGPARNENDMEVETETEEKGNSLGARAGTSTERKQKEKHKGQDQDQGQEQAPMPEVPRLAYPGLWWRATTLALIMCGTSPETIGLTAWNEFPTIKVLIKMITSDRYRFPTIDCDKAARDEMKKGEQSMRDTEASIAEMLFFPKKATQKKSKAAQQQTRSGSRTSRRQREQRERHLRVQQEREAAQARDRERRRKKMIKNAQKSIMILDAHSTPRKPPPQSADLLLSVNDMFSVAKTFQKCDTPDYILSTIGGTSRGAIERAYDWLIPIISVLPETIDRLPSSASCFLLLRAYGTEGEERAQLQSLAKPLLINVRQSLMGEFGEANAARSFDLLLSDVASPKSNRRRCARRVLCDAIGSGSAETIEPATNGGVDAMNNGETSQGSRADHDPTLPQQRPEEEQDHQQPLTQAKPEPLPPSSSWMTNILQAKNAASIVEISIKYMTIAAEYERGKNLKSLIFALRDHIEFAHENHVKGKWSFSKILVAMISTRPDASASAMSSFVDLEALAISTIHDELVKYSKEGADEEDDDAESVWITFCQHAEHSSDDSAQAQVQPQEASVQTKTALPLQLLQSACVLLSIQNDGAEDGDAVGNDDGTSKGDADDVAGDPMEVEGSRIDTGTDKDTAKATKLATSTTLNSIVDMLLHIPDAHVSTKDDAAKEDDMSSDGTMYGLAGAEFADSEKIAVSVESWVMLARSGSDSIARRAAMAAPSGFLPRLLLCSGLPKGSFSTMIDRLAKLGDESDDHAKMFNQLLVPSAVSEWDIGRLGQRRTVSRRLLGRVTAYLKKYNMQTSPDKDHVPNTFLLWLQKSCNDPHKDKGRSKSKNRGKKRKVADTSILKGIASASALFAALADEADVNAAANIKGDGVLADENGSDMTAFKGIARSRHDHVADGAIPSEDLQALIADAFDANEPDRVDWLLERCTHQRDVAWVTIGSKAAPSIASLSAATAATTEAKTPRGTVDTTTIGTLILSKYFELNRKPQGLGMCILKWIPRLTASAGSEELWKIMFAKRNSFAVPVWNSLLGKCVVHWSSSHIAECTNWILRQQQRHQRRLFEEYNVERMVRYLVKTSSADSTTFDIMSQASQDIRWCDSESAVAGGTALAIAAIGAAKKESYIQQIVMRNGIPDELTLILVVARCGRPHARCVGQALVREINSTEDSGRRGIYLAIVLRLYAYLPFSLNLRDASLRAVLKEAVEGYSVEWLEWRSPLDDAMSTMLQELTKGGAVASIHQALMENAKKHPLLLFRKINAFIRALHDDASNKNNLSTEGVDIINQPAVALVQGRSMKVRVAHWGYYFTPSLWTSLLQIVMVVPGEVVFGCGPKMGFTAFLEVYVYLVYVQSHLRPTNDFTRLKGRLSEILNGFKLSNPEAWQTWLSSRQTQLPSMETVRNVLVRCGFVGYDEAMKNIKQGPS